MGGLNTDSNTHQHKKKKYKGGNNKTRLRYIYTPQMKGEKNERRLEDDKFEGK